MQEIKFWRSKQAALNHCTSELTKPIVKMSLELLNVGGYSFHRSTWKNILPDLKNVEREVKIHNNVLTTFPIEGLHKARFLETISPATKEIFDTIKMKITNNRQYPVERSYDLLGTVTRDIATQIRDVLNKDNDLMIVAFEKFENRTKGVSKMFNDIEAQLTKVRNELRQKKMLSSTRPQYSSYKSTQFGTKFEQGQLIGLKI